MNSLYITRTLGECMERGIGLISHDRRLSALARFGRHGTTLLRAQGFVAVCAVSLLMTACAPCMADDQAGVVFAYQLLAQGKVAAAHKEFDRLTNSLNSRGQADLWAEAVSGQAQACLAGGSSCSALDLLVEALAKVDGNSAAACRLQLTLGIACQQAGRFGQAEVALIEAARLGVSLGLPSARAEAALELGTLAGFREIQEGVVFTAPQGDRGRRGFSVVFRPEFQAEARVMNALDSLSEAVRLSLEARRPDLAVRGLLRLAHFQTLVGNASSASATLARAQAILSTDEFRSATASHWLSCGLLRLALLRSSGLTLSRDLAAQCFKAAAAKALATEDWSSLSYARGLEGQLLELNQKWPEAELLTGEALFLAQRAGNQRALFEWQWQAARILAAQGRDAAARDFYRVATETFRKIRGSFRVGQRSLLDYQSNPGDAFFELANLNLRLADSTKVPEQATSLLRQARDAVEAYKTFEVESQFLDAECSALVENLSGNIEQVLESGGKDAAIIYVLPLSDRTEILVTLPGQRQERWTVRKGRQQMEALANQLRVGLAAGVGIDPGVRNAAESLHRDLIQPIEPLLMEAGIQQLVFVLEGALARVPMAVLHDGNGFLIEKYAVANSPGLALMEPGRARDRKPAILLGGLTTEEPDFKRLQYVGEEVQEIGRLFKNVTLVGDEFTGDRLRDAIAKQSFNMVHLASHASFGGSPETTFVVVRGRRINLNELADLVRPTLLREKPIELLAFSACESAKGNDRLELGLAGVALKSGARSVLATLWSVDDLSTARLMTEFYRQLGANPELTKAQALRAAQLSLIKDPQFSHPYQWGPVVLVGNWL